MALRWVANPLCGSRATENNERAEARGPRPPDPAAGKG
ncbi:hypothetical protein AK812_SmicGene45911, partial [Symbiodinium microadriaticum]